MFACVTRQCIVFAPIFDFLKEGIQSRDQVASENSEKFIRQKWKYTWRGPSEQIKKIQLPQLVISIRFLCGYDLLGFGFFLLWLQPSYTLEWGYELGTTCTVPHLYLGGACEHCLILRFCACLLRLFCPIWLNAPCGRSYKSQILWFSYNLHIPGCTMVAIQDVLITGLKCADLKAFCWGTQVTFS